MTVKLNNLNVTALVFVLSLAFSRPLLSQCGSPVALGQAFNMLTMVKNSTNPVAVDKNLGAVLFTHRHNSSVFGGNSGNLRYDVSANGGSAWTLNQGVLNPLSTYPARYPNAVIYNPAGNTSLTNAYTGYMAATIDGGGFWNGVVTGVRKLNGSGNTEAYNQTSAPSYLVPSSLVKGAAGTFWAVDESGDGINYTGDIHVLKGTWNGTNDISWSTNAVLTPGLDFSYNGNPFIGDCNIAFDPTGTKGWICFMGHISSFSYVYHPIFYKTTNGGASWLGPFEVDPNMFSCITSNLAPGGEAAFTYMSDLAVDVNGNPHMLATVGNAGASAYGINYSQWHHMVDITSVNDMWTAYDLGNVKSTFVSFTGSNASVVTQVFSPQVSRTADGSKLFFGWSDNTAYTLGAPNSSPDLFVKGFDVLQQKWTVAKDFSSCNVATAGKIFFAHMSEEVLEPTAGNYKLAPVYAEFITPGDPDMPVNFKFLDNATFSNADFSILQPSAPLAIQQGSAALMCAGTAFSLNISGTYSEVLWSTGSSLNTVTVNAPGQYVVTARAGCLVGSDTITVKTLTMNAAAANGGTVCESSTVSLNVTGNAYSYTWTPGSLTGTSIAVTPSASTVYTVTASGDGCTTTAPVNVIVYPSPSIITISNRAVICAGEQAILQAGGANITIYVWSSGATTSSAVVSPTATTVYTLTAINNLGCAGTASITQVVDACVGINALNKEKSFLQVYPNPSAGSIHVQADEGMTLALVNELGQLVSLLELNAGNGRSASVNGLAKGMYVLTGQSHGQPVHQKIIVE